jgi:hypothetical protein
MTGDPDGPDGMTDTPWRRVPTVLWRRVFSGIIALPAGADEPLALSGAAALVWELLDQPGDLGQLESRARVQHPDLPPAGGSILADALALLAATDLVEPR